MKKNLLLFFVMAGLMSCQQNQKSVSPAGSENSALESISATIYTDKVELFAEFRPLIVGDTAKLGGHFTHLGEYFKAITDGTITISLIVGDNTISQTSAVSSSPGIFRFEFIPVKAGIGKLEFDVKNNEFTDRIVIDSITVYTDANEALRSVKKESKGNEISFFKEQAWKIEFANMEVTPQSFSEVIKTTGELLPAPGDEMVITANASGIVTFSSDKTIVGESVKKDEMIFAISGGNLTDGNVETQFKKAKAAYEKARIDYERAQELTKDNIVSQKDFLAIKEKYETEQANYSNLSRNYQAGGQKVASPLSGYVKNVLVTEGQYVTTGQPLATVSQNSRLLLRAEVSQKNFPKLGAITSANFKSAFDNKTYNIETLNGKLLSYGKNSDANTLFIPVTFSIENKGDFIPGTLAEVFLKLKSYNNAMVIPVSALIEEQGLFYAYVQTAGESFVKRELTLGGTDGINIQVLKGLDFGERVVTKGAYQIKLASASGVIPAHGHAH